MPPPTKPAPAPNLEEYAVKGDVVEWFPGADRTQPPQVAIVTRIEFGGQLTVNVIGPDLRDMQPVDGCRHLDGRAARGEDNGGGGWRHRRETVLFRATLLRQGLLVWRAGQLESAVMNTDGFSKKGGDPGVFAEPPATAPAA